MIKNKTWHKKTKLQACSPGTVFKYSDVNVLGYLIGSSETPGKLLVLHPSGRRDEIDKTTEVEYLLGPDDARLTLLRMLGLMEEI